MKWLQYIDIDIDIANILDHKYRYHIDIGKGDIYPTLTTSLLRPKAESRTRQCKKQNNTNYEQCHITSHHIIKVIVPNHTD